MAGANLQGLYNQGAEKRQQEEQARQMAAQEQSAQQQTGSWTCSCGTLNEGKFCMNCGSPNHRHRRTGFAAVEL